MATSPGGRYASHIVNEEMSSNKSLDWRSSLSTWGVVKGSQSGDLTLVLIRI
jgi:hypothetical protein